MRRYITDHLVTPQTKVIDQWVYEWESRITPPDGLLGNITRAEYLRYQSKQWDRSENVIVLTHSFFYSFMKRWANFSFATLLRDPIKRIISQFGVQKRTFEHFKGTELSAWLDSISAFEFNMQTAAFCGAPILDIGVLQMQMAKANLHYFDFIGFVDEYEESLKLFNRIYKIQRDEPPPTLNVSLEKAEVSEDLLAQLRQRCRYDIELVEYAHRLYRAKQAALEITDAGNPAIAPPSIT